MGKNRERRHPSLDWVFRPGPEDGGKDFGNANSYATPADLRTLVRETTQNSLDAALDPTTPVHISWTLIELKHGTPKYRAFLEAMNFDLLKPHIERAATTPSKLAVRLRAGIKSLEARPLWLLRIEDFSTTGLYGEETKALSSEEVNPFAGLVRNNMDSAKSSTTAAGAYGLGKAVLWRCSDISTVLFSSRVSRGEPMNKNLRFIGKSELTWHNLEASDDLGFAGPGWYGTGKRPESAWLPAESLTDLFLARSDVPPGLAGPRLSGTSILVVGFRDPKSEDQNAENVFRVIQGELARNYWPAFESRALTATVMNVKEGEVVLSQTVDPESHVPRFMDALRRRAEGRVVQELREPGDVATRTVLLSVPATRRGAGGVKEFNSEVESPCQLVVRLMEDEARPDDEYEGTVALVRGRDMVVQYKPQKNLVVGGRRFTAVLLCGERAGSSPELVAAEQFLRLAEPPAHDKWEFNDDIRERYAPGAARRMADLWHALSDALKELIRPQEGSGEEGPEGLRRLLQLPMPVEPRQKVLLRNVSAKPQGAGWGVTAEIHINDRKNDLLLGPRLRVEGESGINATLLWKDLKLVSHGRGSAVQSDGEHFTVKAGTAWISFSGTTLERPGDLHAARCRVRLDVTAHPVETTEAGG